ncbi:MAG: sugar phosphate isomerase/epimerase [Phycisphaerae bacterium]|nr:sugar phosphate isomerase/epimerase [Phycisphaerae bacterium]
MQGKRIVKQKKTTLSRRSFLAGSAGAIAALGGKAAWAQAAPQSNTKIYLFSKHLQWLDYERMSEAAAALELDGLDLTVRPGGHVQPERVKEDLPRAVEAMKKAGLTIDMMTTGINDPRDKHTRAVLETAAALGFKHYRMGYFKYDLNHSIPEQLDEWRPMFKDLAAMNKHYRLHGAYQNHAGRNYLGAPIWDLWQLIGRIEPQELGCQFDIRHATVEGGQAWPIDFKLIAPHITSIIAKDFYWENSGSGWNPVNCPLGAGMVQFSQYFDMVKRNQVAGPLSLHLEYNLGGAEHGRQPTTMSEKNVFDAIGRDLTKVKTWCHNSGL